VRPKVTWIRLINAEAGKMEHVRMIGLSTLLNGSVIVSALLEIGEC
jgi:hypothetical protein